MRAHLTTYAEDLLQLGWPGLVHGISLRSRRAEQQLRPQDCLYSLTIREPDRPPAPRVLGALAAVSTGPEAAIDAICSADTRLVTLTVTEKGYDLVTDGPAPSTPAVIARGLSKRDRALPAPVFASLDNLTSNGEVLRAAVLAESSDLGGDLTSWISDEVRFADSVVDRLVPASTPADLAEAATRLGLRDEGAVVCEQHRSWVISRVEGLPPLDDVGVVVTDDIATHETHKLWLLNGPHSALAYSGSIVGCATIDTAAAHPLTRGFAERIARAAIEVLPAAAAPAARQYAARSLQRFRNPALGHTCAQVGADGSQKLRQRIVPVVIARMRRGLDVGDHAALVACWLACATGMEIRAAAPQSTDDPLGPTLRAALRSGGIAALAAAGTPEEAPREFLREVHDALGRLRRSGAAVLEARE